ncbi:MAG TPA: serine hydrolase [Croceibacterium sp.]|jgi:beta-lactamase class A|nr:serine hydrolase [Croceibacterium sp.]
MKLALFERYFAPLALAAATVVPAHATNGTLDAQFDSVIGNAGSTPDFTAHYDTSLTQQIAQLAADDRGRIGVAAIDLSTGKVVSVLGNQRFPLASTSKIAIVATFLRGVDQGKWSLDDRFPMMVTSSRAGRLLSARDLIELAITRSDNQAADGLLRVVGGPDAVNEWVHSAGIKDFSLNRDIYTLVREDGAIDPARQVDMRDSATPLAMATLLKGLYDGRWLSASSRNVLLGAMGRCKTGPQRIPGQLPDGVDVAHKTGTLYNTSSDVGIVTGPDGHAIAMAIYVTGGKNNHQYRFEKIGTIARAVYDGYEAQWPGQPGQVWTTASYPRTASASAP